MKRICYGCNIAAQNSGMADCAFCRTAYPDNDADALAMIQARAQKKDPAAINLLGEKYFFGSLGLQKDMQKAVELYTEAAELGSIEALHHLRDRIALRMGFRRTRQRVFSSTKKRRCKDTSSVDTTLA